MCVCVCVLTRTSQIVTTTRGDLYSCTGMRTFLPRSPTRFPVQFAEWNTNCRSLLDFYFFLTAVNVVVKFMLLFLTNAFMLRAVVLKRWLTLHVSQSKINWKCKRFKCLCYQLVTTLKKARECWKLHIILKSTHFSVHHLRRKHVKFYKKQKYDETN